jgi:hypothetical protein
VTNSFVPRIRDELFPAACALLTAKRPFKNFPEAKGSRWSEFLTAENEGVPSGKTKLLCQVAFVE